MKAETPTLVIVNADDFGCSRGVNRGIVEAHARGIVTSTSLLVRRPAAAEAVSYAKDYPDLDFGLHVELRHWRTERRPWSRLRSERKLQAAVEREVTLQLELFHRLLGRHPTHLDSHQHRHRLEPLRPIFQAFARELDIPLRHFAAGIQFCGSFYGHDGRGRPDPASITPEALIALLGRLPEGVTELCSHPGYLEGLKMWYREERLQEVRTLCDPRVREATERLGIRLTSFRELGAYRESRAAES